ncbi:DNA-binding protein [Streptomyces sp. NPDC007264]|uniref:nSTAND1 domain-containing NTPase n=1 Tax=Streptomyces sp. NPDC007264 TaxID=3364777 RepID=UPI0036D7E114
MGRRERPVDPAAGPVQRFAHDLRDLRHRAGGPPYREMARRAGYSVSALSQAAAGDRLPSLAVALAYVRACDGDPVRWERRWREVAGQERADDDTDAPYQGLARFEPGDHERFFGRDELAGTLLRRVRTDRFTALVGPSGSGKSSLLRAGLIPALCSVTDGAPAAVRILTPGARPLRTHGAVLRAKDGPGDTVVVVDQFEEVFTLCQDATERAEFIDRLLAAGEPAGRLRVVIAVRADFYGRCAEHRRLAEALGGAGLLVGPMTPAELREVVVRPAQRAGLQVERELAERLVELTAGEPGGLPLLSHVLRETWLRRRGRTLTTEAYEAAGGLRGAIARTAEKTYGGLSPAQRAPARLLLLRLITPGEGAQDTRRPVSRAELDFARAADIDPVVDRLSRARLITLDDDTVHLAHEALITSWPRLSGWIDEHRERLRVHRRLTEAARSWDELGRDPGSLYRGTRLAMAEERLVEAELDSLERAFLTASRAARTGEGRRRRLVTGALAGLVALSLLAGTVAWRQSETSHRRQLQAEARRVAALADGVRLSDPVTAMRLSVAAWRLADTAETRSALLTARYRPERDVLDLPHHASGADSGDPEALDQAHLSADGRTVMSVSADRIRTWDVRTHRLTHTYPGVGEAARDAYSAVVGPDGRTLSLAGEDVRLWDVRAGRVTATFHGPASLTAFGSARTLAVALDQDQDIDVPVGEPLVRVWDVTRHRVLLDVPRSRPAESYAEDLAVSRDDRWLAVCGEGEPLRVWDIAHRRRLGLHGLPRGSCHEEGDGLAFSPDGRTLAAATGSRIRLWDLRTGRELSALDGGGAGLRSPAFVPGGFVTAARDDELLLWRRTFPAAPVFRHPLVGETPGEVRADSADHVLRYLNSAGTSVRSLDVTGVVTGGWLRTRNTLARLTQDGRTLAVLGGAGGVHRPGYRLLDTRTGRVTDELPGRPCTADEDLGAGDDPWELPASDSDRVAASMSSSAAGTASLPEPWEESLCTDALAFSADGGHLAHTLGEPRGVVVRDLTGGRDAVSVALPRATSVDALALSADGRRLVMSVTTEKTTRTARGTTTTETTEGVQSVEVWDVGRRGRPLRLRTLHDMYGGLVAVRPGPGTFLTWQGTSAEPDGSRATTHTLGDNPASALAFSPDGSSLAVGDTLGRVTVWDGGLRSRIAVLSGTRTADATGAADGVSALAFSPDGRTLAVAGASGTVRLWNVFANQPFGSALPTPGDPVVALAFSPDGHRLYASGIHAVLRTYGLSPAGLAARVCARAGGGLSRAAWRTYLPDVPYRRTCTGG